MTAPTKSTCWPAKANLGSPSPAFHTGPVRVPESHDRVAPWGRPNTPFPATTCALWLAHEAVRVVHHVPARLIALATVVSRELSDADHAAAEAQRAERQAAETERILAQMIDQSRKYGL